MQARFIHRFVRYMVPAQYRFQTRLLKARLWVFSHLCFWVNVIILQFWFAFLWFFCFLVLKNSIRCDLRVWIILILISHALFKVKDLFTGDIHLIDVDNTAFEVLSNIDLHVIVTKISHRVAYAKISLDRVNSSRGNPIKARDLHLLDVAHNMERSDRLTRIFIDILSDLQLKNLDTCH